MIKAQTIVTLHGASDAAAFALTLAEGVEEPRVNLGLMWGCGWHSWLLLPSWLVAVCGGRGPVLRLCHRESQRAREPERETETETETETESRESSLAWPAGCRRIVVCACVWSYA